MMRVFVTAVRVIARQARRLAGGGDEVDTAHSRHQRELARSEGQAGHNLTVQTTIDMARTQTWTGGG